MSAFQKLLMGGFSDTGSAYIPYTLLTWPNDPFFLLPLIREGWNGYGGSHVPG